MSERKIFPCLQTEAQSLLLHHICDATIYRNSNELHLDIDHARKQMLLRNNFFPTLFVM